MTTVALLEQLRRLGVTLASADGRLRVSGPRGAITPGMRRELAERRAEILEALHRGDAAPIERIARGVPLPLSFAQERLWFLDRLEPGSAAYNIPLLVELEGPLDRAALEGALDDIVRRHEVLRAACLVRDGRPHLEVVPVPPLQLAIDDLSSWPGSGREAELERRAREEARRPFDLAIPPLLRARLFRLGHERHVALLVTHHFVADAWSMGVMMREIGVGYEARARGAAPALAAPVVQYADAAAWQRHRLAGPALEREIGWWTERLAGAPRRLELPLDWRRPAVRAGRGGRVSFVLEPGLAQGLRSLARGAGCTLFMTVLAGLQALLHRLTDQSDLVVATAVSSRPRAELESLIGCFANELLLRADFSDDPSFSALLARTRERAVEAYAHQDLPFEKLVEALRPERDLSVTPLYQVLFVLEPALPAARVAALALRVRELDPGTARSDLTLHLTDGEAALPGVLEYDADLFERSTAEAWVERLRALLTGAVSDPSRRISELPVIGAGERQRLAEWNATAEDLGPPATLHGLVAEQAARTPDAVAVECGDAELTWRELTGRAGRLSSELRARGIEPEERVAIGFERSFDLVTGLLGILGAGGAWVPVDPEYPAERIDYMLEDSGARWILARPEVPERLPRDVKRLFVESLESAPSPPADWRRARPAPRPIDPNRLAYAIYTSGSTGRPKAALNTHAGIVNRLRWMQRSFRLAPGDRVLQKTPISFDVSVWELFWPLLAGARLVLAPPGLHRDASGLARLIEARGITVAHFVPSMLQDFLAHAELERCGSLRRVVCSGEALTPALVRRFHESLGAELHNLYGPTEAAVDVTHWACPRGDTSGVIPIGRPIANTRACIVDARQREVPVGVPGELLLGGVQLARGYLGRPALTAARFVPDPSGPPGARLYRTGDRARWRFDGTIEFLGRLDGQIKLRGVRIEPAEIEVALAAHPAVAAAAVELREDAHGGPRLIAHVVPHAGGAPDPEALRRHLRQSLPETLVPAAFVMCQRLPLSPSGKLDRRALPPPGAPAAEAPRARALPRTPTEKTLAGIWSEILQVSQVSVNDHFFEAGGHSLIATRLLSRVRDALEVELPLRILFETPVLVDLASAIDACRTRTAGPALERVTDETPELSLLQERLWFLDRFEPGNPAFHMPLRLHLRGDFERGACARALAALLERHHVLRATFAEQDGRPLQRIGPPSPFELPSEDLRSLPGEERGRAAERAAADAAARPFDLARGPLVRGRVLQLADQEYVLCLTFHHIVCDGWSLGVIATDLAALYVAECGGAQPPATPVLQFGDFARWERARIGEDRLAAGPDFWKRELAGSPACIELPTDRPRPPLQTFRGARASRLLDATRTERILAIGRRSAATPFMTLLAAFGAVLHRWSGQADVVVGTAVARRERRELEDVVGPLLGTLALRLRMGGNPSFEDALARTRETALSAFEHQDVPFERVLEVVKPPRDLSRTPVFQVFFNLLSFPVARIELPALVMEPIAPPEPPAKFDLTMYAQESPAGMQLDLVYNADLFDAARIEHLLDQYERLLDLAIAEPGAGILEHDLVAPRARAVVPDPAAALDDGWPGPIHEQVAEWARREPGRPAIVDGRGALSRGDLQRMIDAVARHLIAHGAGRGDVVAIVAHRSAELAAAVLGVLRSGAAFSLIDPAHPAARLVQMLELARPRAVLRLETAGAVPTAVEELLARCPGLTVAAHPAAGGNPPEPPRIAVGPDDPACVGFTSGSTGRPKAIVGLHRSLTHFLPWQAERFGIREEDRFSLLSGLAHDPIQRDLFTSLGLGATLCVPEAGVFETPGALAGWAARELITVVHLTPALLQLMVQDEPDPLPALRLALIVGDVLTPRAVFALRRLAPRVTCVNLYGATETQRAVGHHVVPADQAGGTPEAAAQALPLGRGVPDVQLLVLNPAGRLASVGELGEIVVRSPHLAQGYLEDPGLTRARFTGNPLTGRRDDRCYHTGDLGRYRPDGEVEWAGRADRQVQVRGFRVEPGEIEAVLASHPAVRDAAVIPREVEGERRLVAYVARREAVEPPALRAHLSERLPDPMLPSAFVFLDRLPLTPNGKLDLAALPAPGPPQRSARSRPPRDNVELELSHLWREVLGVEEVDVQDDFFALGGHSLLAVQLLARVRAVFGRTLPLSSLFRSPTLEGFAALVRRQPAGGPRGPLVPIQPNGARPPFFCVHPIGGTVLCYQPLAHRLGGSQPFYALEAPGVEGGQPPLESVEAMARLYVRAVAARQAAGPYRIGGWSFGGLVAFEMARLLYEQGAETHLVLLDTWTAEALGPAAEEFDRDTTARLIARALGELTGREFAVEAETLRALGDRERQLAHVVAEARRAEALPPEVGVEQLRPLFDVVDANLRARRAYRPRPWPGRGLLVRARQPLLPPPDDVTLGWGRLVEGGVEVVTVPGDHYTMLTEPNVSEAAQRLGAYLENPAGETAKPPLPLAGSI